MRKLLPTVFRSEVSLQNDYRKTIMDSIRWDPDRSFGETSRFRKLLYDFIAVAVFGYAGYEMIIPETTLMTFLDDLGAPPVSETCSAVQSFRENYLLTLNVFLVMIAIGCSVIYGIFRFARYTDPTSIRANLSRTALRSLVLILLVFVLFSLVNFLQATFRVNQCRTNDSKITTQMVWGYVLFAVMVMILYVLNRIEAVFSERGMRRPEDIERIQQRIQAILEVHGKEIDDFNGGELPKRLRAKQAAIEEVAAYMEAKADLDNPVSYDKYLKDRLGMNDKEVNSLAANGYWIHVVWSQPAKYVLVFMTAAFLLLIQSSYSSTDFNSVIFVCKFDWSLVNAIPPNTTVTVHDWITKTHSGTPGGDYIEIFVSYNNTGDWHGFRRLIYDSDYGDYVYAWWVSILVTVLSAVYMSVFPAFTLEYDPFTTTNQGESDKHNLWGKWLRSRPFSRILFPIVMIVSFFLALVAVFVIVSAPCGGIKLAPMFGNLVLITCSLHVAWVATFYVVWLLFPDDSDDAAFSLAAQLKDAADKVKEKVGGWVFLLLVLVLVSAITIPLVFLVEGNSLESVGNGYENYDPSAAFGIPSFMWVDGVGDLNANATTVDPGSGVGTTVIGTTPPPGATTAPGATPSPGGTTAPAGATTAVVGTTPIPLPSPPGDDGDDSSGGGGGGLGTAKIVGIVLGSITGVVLLVVLGYSARTWSTDGFSVPNAPDVGKAVMRMMKWGKGDFMNRDGYLQFLNLKAEYTPVTSTVYKKFDTSFI